MIPYYRQEKDWSCGATCFRMILASFGIRRSENYIIKLLGTNGRYGTRNKAFPLLAEKFHFTYLVRRNSSLHELRLAYRQGYRIIVNYHLRDEDTGHFSVIEKLTAKSISLLDPWEGRRKYSLHSFLKAWNTVDPKLADVEKRWFFGVFDTYVKNKK